MNNSDLQPNAALNKPDLHKASVRRMSLFNTAAFVSEANELCSQIVAGMQGLGKNADDIDYDELILMILRRTAGDFKDYA